MLFDYFRFLLESNGESQGSPPMNRANHFEFYAKFPKNYIEYFISQTFEFKLSAILTHIEYWAVNNFIMDKFHSPQIILKRMPNENSLIAKQRIQEGM